MRTGPKLAIFVSALSESQSFQANTSARQNAGNSVYQKFEFFNLNCSVLLSD